MQAVPSGREVDLRDQIDGYRCVAVKRGRDITLFSRHKKVLNRRFPGVVQALASLEGDFVLDGELVAMDSHGRPSFQLLTRLFFGFASNLFLRLRFTESKWRPSGEFAFL